MNNIVIEHRVDWSYCDPAGIIFYPEYYIWFDQATERLFEANGLSYENVRNRYNLIGFPLVESGAEYRAPCKHGDEVKLHSHVDEWAGKTFVVKHRIVHNNGVVAVEGFERRVWAVADPGSAKGMKAEKIPEEVCDLFAQG